MDMSDPLTADFPTRNTDQDEEMAASSDANLAHQRPAIYWDSVTSSSFVDGKLHVKQLVIATSPASCQLLRHCCPAQQAAGVIMLPEQAQEPGITLPSPADKVCFMYLMNDNTGQPSQPDAISQQNGSSSIDKSVFQLTLSASAAAKQRECSLLVFCQVPLQPERAISWVRGLLTVVQAQHVLVLASLPAFSYRGPGDPNEEALHYVIQSTAAKQQSKDKHQIPSLPSGSLITGLAAAAIQHAEVRRQGATVLIGVESRPVPDFASLTQLAQSTEQVLKTHGSGFMQADSLLKAAKHAEKTLSSAATNSFMYV
ncbi:hypothetical protein WJX77_004897 [Trebouxia sp. C0004]